MKSIRVITYSTNPSEISPFTVLQKYFTGCECKNIRNCENFITEFQIKISDILIKVKYYTVNFFAKHKNESLLPSTLCKKGDSFIIFIPLNHNQNNFQNLEQISQVIKAECDPDKKIHMIGVKLNEEEKDDNNKGLNEDKITNYLDSKRIFYDYREISFENLNSICSILNSIFLEAEAEKNTNDDDEEEKEKNQTEKDTHCIIL